MARTATLKFALSFLYDQTVGTEVDEYKPTFVNTDNLTAGTGENQYDRLWNDSRTLNGTENLDLAGGLTDAHGTTLTFVKVKGLWILNKSTTLGQTLRIGGNPTSSFLLFDDVSDTLTIDAEGMFFYWDPRGGKTVTAGSADLLTVVSSISLTYDIAIFGTSA